MDQTLDTRRSQHGARHALLQELTTEDPDGFRNFF